MSTTSHYPGQIGNAETVQQLQNAGVIGQIDGDFPSDEILEIGDALLASPIFAIAVVHANSQTLKAIAALRERGGEHMLVGASNICTTLDVSMVADAGAQFIVSPYFDYAASTRAQVLAIPYLPGIFVRDEAEEALAAGRALQHLFPVDILGPSHIVELRTALPDCKFIPSSGVHLHNITAHAQAGAAAVIVDCGPEPGAPWTQAEIITYVRSLRRVWEQAKALE
ncbi:MAG TPA: hypothetical protein G4N94_01645 [Caldilineae bacterium]|nr:hypothetical protein [Caldilineae bacterium]